MLKGFVRIMLAWAFVSLKLANFIVNVFFVVQHLVGPWQFLLLCEQVIVSHGSGHWHCLCVRFWSIMIFHAAFVYSLARSDAATQWQDHFATCRSLFGSLRLLECFLETSPSADKLNKFLPYGLSLQSAFFLWDVAGGCVCHSPSPASGQHNTKRGKGPSWQVGVFCICGGLDNQVITGLSWHVMLCHLLGYD